MKELDTYQSFWSHLGPELINSQVYQRLNISTRCCPLVSGHLWICLMFVWFSLTYANCFEFWNGLNYNVLQYPDSLHPTTTTRQKPKSTIGKTYLTVRDNFWKDEWFFLTTKEGGIFVMYERGDNSCQMSSQWHKCWAQQPNHQQSRNRTQTDTWQIVTTNSKNKKSNINANSLTKPIHKGQTMIKGWRTAPSSLAGHDTEALKWGEIFL